MAGIGGVVVQVSASTGALASGMKRAGGIVEGFQSKVSGMMGGAISFAGLAAGAAAFALNVKKGFDDIDAIGNTAEKLGIATEKMVGLQEAAKMADVSTESLEQGLDILSRKLGQAAMGATDVEKDFKRFGISAKELSTLSLDKSFSLIVGRISQITNPTERAAAMMAIFGKSGKDMTNMMKGGAAAIQEATDRAREIGLAFTELDAAKIDEADNAMKSLGQHWNALGRTIAIKVAPVVSNLARGFDRIFSSETGLQDFGKALANTVTGIDIYDLSLKSATSQGNEFFDSSANAAGAANRLKAANREMAESIEDLNEKFRTQIGTLGQSSNELDIFKLKQRGATDEMLKATVALKEQAEQAKATSAARELAEAIEDQARTFGMSARQIQIWKLAMDGADSKILEQAHAWDVLLDTKERDKGLREQAEKITKDTRTPTENFSTKADELKNLFDEGFLDTDVFERAVTAMSKDLGEEVGKGLDSSFGGFLSDMWELQKLQEAGLLNKEALALGVAGKEDAEDKKGKKLSVPKSPEAFIKGSSEAMSAINEHKMGGEMNGVEEQAKTTNQKLDIANRLLSEMTRLLGKVGFEVFD